MHILLFTALSNFETRSSDHYYSLNLNTRLSAELQDLNLAKTWFAAVDNQG